MAEEKELTRDVATSVTRDGDEVLAGLGVVGYDQLEFEAIVMKDLDHKAERESQEQQRKFAAKELTQITSQIRQTEQQLSLISRQITSLLVRPLSSIVKQLTEQRTLQTEKKTCLLELEKRKQRLQDCLAKDDYRPLSRNSSIGLISHDQQSHDQQSRDLIKSGLLTPFGTTSTDKGVGSAAVTDSPKEDTPPSFALAEFDWLGLQEQSMTIKGKGKGPGKMKVAREGSCDRRDGSDKSGTMSIRNEDRNEDISHRNESWNDVTNDKVLNIKRKRRKPRPPTEDEDSDGDVVHVNWGGAQKGNKRTRKKGGGCGHDDGDVRLYKERLRQNEVARLEEHDEEEPPVEFDGGFKVPSTIWNKLYRYQQTCVKWMWELHCQQAGGIMGDEMGLGKTIQMIAFLAGLKISNLRSHVTRKVGLGPVLIACPATVLYQWVAEFHKWYPVFRVAVLHDTGSFVGTKESLLTALTRCDGVVVTTYANIRLYNNLLLRHHWDYVILDEGHKIRNPDAEITLACKQFATPHRIILSGSPMQNNLRELWSLFDFVFPGKLGTLPVFMDQFSVPITIGGYANASQMQVETAYQCACVLRDSINPYLLRRLKTDVKLQLPNKNEQVLFCRLTDYQRELYQDYIQGPEVQAMMSGRRWVFSGLTKLRKLCNHPDLVTLDYHINNGVELVEEDDIIDNNGAESSKKDCVDTFIDTSRIKRNKVGVATSNEDVYGHHSRSGKMAVVETLLKIWQRQKNKVLLFTQSRGMLKIFESFLISSNYSFLKMDGCTPISSRQNLIKRFNEDANIFVFLLTTRVGGLGINLTGADRVIIFDPDWNPSTDTQARERAWRIGQKKPVTIYRLLTSGTIEEKIYHRQIFKQFLTNRVLRDPRQRRFFKSNDLYELFTLGSSNGPHTTETGAIFAGTGSEVSVKTESHTSIERKKKQKRKKHGSEDQEEDVLSNRKKSKLESVREKEKSQETITGTLEREKDLLDHEPSGLAGNESTGLAGNESTSLAGNESTSLAGNESTGLRTSEAMQSPCISIEEHVTNGEETEAVNNTIILMNEPGPSGVGTNGGLNSDGLNNGGSNLAEIGVGLGETAMSNTVAGTNVQSLSDDQVSIEELLAAFRRRRKKKKKKRKKRLREAELEGHRIKGIERMDQYDPGSEDEQDKTMDKQNNIILKQLFKKSGIDTAMQHDTIMSSGDPDFAIVEAEANRVARSAAKALKDSRQRCLQGMGGTNTWGQPTWTGVHGTVGAPKRRFGNSSKESQSTSTSSSHFTGSASKGDSISNKESSSLSSSVLLTKMRKRNAHHIPDAGRSGIHSSGHQELMKRIRDFVALDCKKNGEATTDEILGKFAADLAPSESAVFRSMLHEICNYHRYHGEGIWTLKSEYR